MSKVYVIANTQQEDFIIRAVTADKEMADGMYAKLTEKYRGTEFESDLEMLEFSQEDSFSLLGQARYQGKKIWLRYEPWAE